MNPALIFFPSVNTKTLIFLSEILISFLNSKMEEKYGEREGKKTRKNEQILTMQKKRRLLQLRKKVSPIFLRDVARDHRDPLAGLFVAKYPWAQVAHPSERGRRGWFEMLVTGGNWSTSSRLRRSRTFRDFLRDLLQLGVLSGTINRLRRAADAERILSSRTGAQSQPMTMGKETYRGEAMTDRRGGAFLHAWLGCARKNLDGTCLKPRRRARTRERENLIHSGVFDYK